MSSTLTHDDHGWLSARVVGHAIRAPYLFLELKPEVPFHHAPGQYTSFRIVTDGRDVLRHYSIASAPRADSVLEFCIMIAEDGESRRFYEGLEPGHTVSIAVAQGTFTLRPGAGPKVFVAGGSGIAPIRAMLQAMLAATGTPMPLHLVYGCRTRAAFPFNEEFQALAVAHAARLRIWLCAEDGSGPGFQGGRVTDYLAAALLPKAEYYVCGPAKMSAAVVSELMAAGVPHEDMLTERY